MQLIYQKNALSTSQRQTVIKIIDKKERDKTLLKNWKSIFLLNVDLKITLKAFAFRIKTVLPSIISSKQTVYNEKRFIGKAGRLISDILSVTNNLKIERYLVTMDIEKAFDSLGQNIFNLLEHPFLFL